MIKTALSKASDTGVAVADLAQQLAGVAPSLVILFYSVRHDGATIAMLASKTWPQARTIGCSTAGEMIAGEMTDGALVAMAIDQAVADEVSVAMIDDLGERAQIDAAHARLGALASGDPDTHVGIVLIDGMSGKEEKLMERLGDLSDLRFIGGSAGDDLAFQATTVFADGRSANNAAVLAILHVPAGFRIVKTQSFCRTGKTLIPTRVDTDNREVIEFDHRPASEAYMAAVGATTMEQAAGKFMTNPVGLMNGDDPYVRSPQVFNGDAMKFYCAVTPGMDLELLESTDIVKDTAKALDAANADGRVIGLLNFNCILRTLELKAKNLTDDYARLFSVPMVGFSTYGEADIGHINQTATMIAFVG